MTLSLEPILQSTRFPFYLEQLQQIAAAERRRRDEFYEWLTEDTKAEFINGEVIVQSPAKDRHTDCALNLSTMLRTYVDEHELGIVRAETTLVSLTRNDYLPDICFFGPTKAARIQPDQMKYPAPDLVIEILSPTTEKIDREIKMVDYAEHNVQEYWLIDPETQSVEQYLLHRDAYQLQSKQQSGTLTSEVVTRFTIPIRAIFDRKLKNKVLVEILS